MENSLTKQKQKSHDNACNHKSKLNTFKCSQENSENKQY